MNRRSFLAASAGVAVCLAGCTSDEVFRIRSVEGISGSNVFEDVEVQADSGIDVHLTEAATVEVGVERLEASERCGTEEIADPWEEEVEPAERTVFLPVGCSGYDSFEVTVVAYGPVDQPVDDFSMTIEYATPTP